MNAARRQRALGLACAFLAFAGPCRSAPPVAAPGYVLADGSIRIVAEKTMEPVLSRLNTLMTRRHPELRFRMIFGDVPVGLDGIIARVSLFAPLAHDAWESEIDPFKRLNGYRPLDVRIGRLGHAGSGRANPPSIYVNAANPLRSLDIDRRIDYMLVTSRKKDGRASVLDCRVVLAERDDGICASDHYGVYADVQVVANP